MELHITKHARQRMQDYNLSEKKLLHMFEKAAECRLSQRLWAEKFRRYGMSNLDVKYKYYTGWLFTYRDGRLLTVYEGAKKDDLIFD